MNDTVSSSNLVSSEINSVEGLMVLDDVTFIECAYQLVLNRAPDSVGMKYYLARLEAGYSKIGVLKQLKCSKEGESKEITVQGLATYIRQYRYALVPILGWILRLFGYEYGDDTQTRTFRFFSQTIRQLETVHIEGMQQLKYQLAELNDRLTVDLERLNTERDELRGQVTILATDFMQKVDELEPLLDSQKTVDQEPTFELEEGLSRYELEIYQQYSKKVAEKVATSASITIASTVIPAVVSKAGVK